MPLTFRKYVKSPDGLSREAFNEDGSPACEVRYAGAVLEDRERNGHDDSDFYALVWDESKGRVVDVEYASTRYAGGGACTVDATPEIREKAEAWSRERVAEGMVEQAKRYARIPERGRRIKVVHGRKLPRGVEGIVTWYGEGKRFSPSRWAPAPMRVRVKLDNGTADFTAAENVEVMNPEQYEMTLEEARAKVGGRRPNLPAMFAPVGWAVL